MPLDLAQGALPSLAFVIPNNIDNMDDGTIDQGDAWLSRNIPAMLGALGERGMLVLTWDEDDGSSANQILTVFVAEDQPLRRGSRHLRGPRDHPVRGGSQPAVDHGRLVPDHSDAFVVVGKS
ncbi:MAG: hypothetical protein E6K73_05375 [Candidatus Eisenbacteria bacterium]|uniref:Acid phosphatase n=1 Tax=Eiseniibacteriota bacterium TaxID=2212470 RepID=A0A538SJS4_UNCEI|nr:MAG: hypothetical protein E6K73_05375 [Candidatus Eisenbacteria bacterium]